MKNKKIIICVPTYKRPNYLKKNLTSLIEQDFDYKHEIVVVDNDINQSAKSVVNKLNDSKIKLNYYTENKRGISAVRNKCIEACKEKNADYLIFIDDDEIAEKNWLKNLTKTAERYKAEVVSGPVLCKFEKEPSNAIQKVFFYRRRLETGSIIENCASGNVLINMDIFKERPHLTFNKNFNIMGGGDTYFFMQVRALGIKMIWCDEAVAHEFISYQRSKLKNLLLEQFQRGHSLFHIINNIDKSAQNLKYSSKSKTLFNIIIINIRLLLYILTLNKYKIYKNLSSLFGKSGFLLASLTGLKSNQYKKIFGK